MCDFQLWVWLLRQEVLRAAEGLILSSELAGGSKESPLNVSAPRRSGQTTPTWAHVGLCASDGDGGRLEPHGCLAGMGRKPTWRGSGGREGLTWACGFLLIFKRAALQAMITRPG